MYLALIILPLLGSIVSGFFGRKVGNSSKPKLSFCIFNKQSWRLFFNNSFGNIDYSTVFSLAPFMSEDVITLIGICLLIGAMAKSSQIGLHV
ncbi:hypothetical protein D6D17_09658 [Aureobasidium pullulans]|uniref:NADH:quinone oxidoreductase/Mrp antiporter membrane subunit domain-containing protein n=1 Tax=Aureobasidium pullulans TaxID=5580 RepID=A0A4S8VPP6_AURPU|nr:hypothetical protein E4T50_16903 [Aureobasidium sp. EXF-12298]THW03594.1 hypothetical protein D6D24_10695 [Aureobasidium pullulans]THW12460.1 hypothetical protein D6D25_07398 [Aureobasidium pullulans]THW32051.1 hypothetical protein D6D22_09821 [Aureobasidium pullulans]THW36502.1 hypothetical protein D6D21_08681 [Aureobasidium pullulans]